MILANSGVLSSITLQERPNHNSHNTTPVNKNDSVMPKISPKQSKKTSLTKTYAMGRVGIVLCCMGLIYVIPIVAILFSGEFAVAAVATCAIFAAIFNGIGISLIVKNKKRNRKKELYQKYIKIIASSDDLHFTTISKRINRTNKKVASDLENMIADGFFAGCRLDYSAGLFILPEGKKLDVFTAEQCVVECASCGAKATIEIGKVVKCEYCGSPLKGKR